MHGNAKNPALSLEGAEFCKLRVSSYFSADLRPNYALRSIKQAGQNRPPIRLFLE